MNSSQRHVAPFHWPYVRPFHKRSQEICTVVASEARLHRDAAKISQNSISVVSALAAHYSVDAFGLDH